ncbi:MAG: F420-dependent methylenetetrahydromethanopterin dehydrogenase [Methanobacteriaceae archaeon]|nr:F420-dependent methylenetetrahydromethanopterin dehydrogenase [Methanobacteriaceae archaeon]
MVVKIGIIKIGNLGTSPLLDLVLDERADRADIDIRTISSGAKMGKIQMEYVLPKLKDFNPNFIMFISPNPGSAQPSTARQILSETGIPTIIIGDKPGESIIEEMEKQNLGYIIIRADPMIGARREFLDPTEMALFNAYVLKVLAITGAFRLVQETIDKVIHEFNNNNTVKLPRVVVTAEKAAEYGDFDNPYAKAKAIAAYRIATEVAEVDITACFKTKDPKRYIPLVTAAHEMIRSAANLASEAREIEKNNDTVLRTPHTSNGNIVRKKSLMDKPE